MTEGERLGGIYVDVGIDDGDVIDRLDAIESKLSALSGKETTVKVRVVEEGGSKQTAAQKKGTKAAPVELFATLKLEENAAANAVKNIKAVPIPVSLSLAEGAIAKLKGQINEAFHDFSIKVNVQYGSATPGGNFSSSTAQEEFAEATGLEGNGPHRKKVVKSFSSVRTPGEAAVPRSVAIASNTQELERLRTELRTLEQKGTTQAVRNTFTGRMRYIERRNNILENTPLGVLSIDSDQPGGREEIERERVTKASVDRQRTRGGRREGTTRFMPKRIITPRAEPVPTARPAVEDVATTETPAGRPVEPYDGAAYRGRAGRGDRQRANNDPRLAAIEEQQRADARFASSLQGRVAGESGGSEFTPRERSHREFDRHGLARMRGDRPRYRAGRHPVAFESVRAGEGIVIRGPRERGELSDVVPRNGRRRQGPTVVFQEGGTRGESGFFDRRPPNQVKQVIDENSLGQKQPAAAAILEDLRLEKFGSLGKGGTPMVEKLDSEGGRTGIYRPLTAAQRRSIITRGDRVKSGLRFGSGENQFEIMNPKDIARRKLRELGTLPEQTERRIFGTHSELDPEEIRNGLLNSPRFAPGVGMGGHGGYVNPAGGPGGAARSIHDTPQGNRENRARIEAGLYQDALERLRIENPGYARMVEQLPTVRRRKEHLKPFRADYGGDVLHQRALMDAAPREFGYNHPELSGAFERYQQGYSGREGLEGFMAEDSQVTPATTYYASISKFLKNYKQEFGYAEKAKYKSLPEQIRSRIEAQAAMVRRDTGYMVPNWDRMNATGGVAMTRVPGAAEEVASRVAPPGAATTRARERRRDYGPIENQFAENEARLERLSGRSGRSIVGIHPGHAIPEIDEYGTVSGFRYAPGAPGTPEEQRRSRAGEATKFTPGALGEVEIAALLEQEAIERAKPTPSYVPGKVNEEPPTDNFGRRITMADKIRAQIATGAPSGVDTERTTVVAARARQARALIEARRLRREQRRLQPAVNQERAEQQARIEAGFAEREAAGLPVDRGTGPILTDKTPLTGDELAAKVAGSQLPYRDIAVPETQQEARARAGAVEPAPASVEGDIRQAHLGRLASLLHGRMATAPTEAERPAPTAFDTLLASVPGFIDQRRVWRGETPESAGQMGMFGPEIVARKAAEDREGLVSQEPPPPGQPPQEAVTNPSAGGPVPVNIVASIPLTFAGGSGGGKGEPKVSRAQRMAESNEDIDPDKIRAAAAGIREKRPDITPEELSKILIKRNYEKGSVLATLGITPDTAKARATTLKGTMRETEALVPGLEYERDERPKDYKSNARIKAETEILQARSLNPTRAFQTAVAAGFAKTIGGGGDFEKRVRVLTRALNVQADFEESLEKVTTSLDKNRINIQKTTEASAQIQSRPMPTDLNSPEYKQRKAQVDQLAIQETSFKAERESLQKQRAEIAPKVTAAQQETSSARRNLISPIGVARGFAALGGGAIVGGLIFGAAQHLVQEGLRIVGEEANKAADKLSGFAITAAKVTEDLAGAVRQGAGNVGAVAGALAPSGMSAREYATLGGQGLTTRAETIAAAQARVQESDAMRAGGFVSPNRLPGGFDKALFEGTGGLLDSPLFAQQPGVMERVAGDFFQNTKIPGFDPLAAANDVLGSFNPFGENFADPYAQSEKRRVVQSPEVTATLVGSLNDQLKKANSSFSVLTNATDIQKKAMVDSAYQISDVAGKQAEAIAFQGAAVVGVNGQGLAGTEFGNAASDIARGQNMVDPRLAFENDKRGLEAQIRQIQRETTRQIDVEIPRSMALQNLAAPQMDVVGGQVQQTGITTQKGAGGAAEQAMIDAGIKSAQKSQNSLNQSYAEGEAILKEQLNTATHSDALFNSIKSTGAEIASIQAGIADAQGKLATHEYDNQLRVAKRTLADIAGLSGKNYGYGKSTLGVLERQNVMLSRQSELLQQELQQRQINFQLAVAGFTVAGQSPEERAARLRDAKIQAEFAQKQLDIQKKMFGTNVKLFNEQNIRAATDALASIGLLTEGREVQIKTTLAEKNLARLNKIQENNVQKAGAYLGAIDKGVQLAYSELYKLEAAYGNAIQGIAKDTMTWFSISLHDMYSAMSGVNFGTGTGGKGPTSQSGYSSGSKNASGFLGNVSGATTMIMGEAGTETVAILRNPRTASLSGSGGGGGVTININHPTVRADSDIRKITNSVVQALNTRTALLGLR